MTRLFAVVAFGCTLAACAPRPEPPPIPPPLAMSAPLPLPAAAAPTPLAAVVRRTTRHRAVVHTRPAAAAARTCRTVRAGLFHKKRVVCKTTAPATGS